MFLLNFCVGATATDAAGADSAYPPDEEDVKELSDSEYPPSAFL